MNFPLFLLIATILTGICALLHHVAKGAIGNWPSPLKYVIEQGSSFFSVFFFVIVLRSFLVEPFRIPSSSLEPTLLVGDFVAVNKFIYGLRFPYFENTLLSMGQPKRGDVIVFRWPPKEQYDYIKRVIGVPGDTVVYQNKRLTVNGKVLSQSDQREVDVRGLEGERISLYQLKECVKPDQCHQIYVDPLKPSQDFTVHVPEGQFFVMGDNRDNSSDSRYWGFVPQHDLKGKAILIWMSWNSLSTSVRWSRLGKMIH